MSDVDWGLLGTPANNNNIGTDVFRAFQAGQDQGNQNVINKQLASGDVEGGRRQAIASGLYNQYAPVLKQMGEEKTAKLKEANNALVSSAIAVRRLPKEQRAAYIQSQVVPYLTSHGYDANDLQGFDPTDDNALDATIRQHMSYADALDLVKFTKDGVSDQLSGTYTQYATPSETTALADGRVVTTPGRARTRYDSFGNIIEGGPVEQPQAGYTNSNPESAPAYNGAPLTGRLNPSSAAGYLTSLGLPAIAAAGIAGNIMGESSGNHQAVGDGGRAYGLAQWHPDRQAAFARKYGKDIRNSTQEEQLQFVVHELKTTEPRAYQALMNAKTPEEAAEVFMRYYERPSAAAMRSSLPDRQRAARQGYGGQGSAPTGDQGGNSPQGGRTVNYGNAQVTYPEGYMTPREKELEERRYRESREDARDQRQDAREDRRDARQDRRSNISSEADMRGEFEKSDSTKNYYEAKGVHQDAEKAAKMARSGNGAAAIALLYAGAKAIASDGSVIRPEEFKTVAEAQDWYNRNASRLGQLIYGNRLTPNGIQNILNLTYGRYQRAATTYNSAARRTVGLARDAGLDPSHVVRGYDVNGSDQPKRNQNQGKPNRAGPVVGQIVNRNGKNYKWTGSTWTQQ